MKMHPVSFVFLCLDKDGLSFCDQQGQAQPLPSEAGELCPQRPYFPTELAAILQPQGAHTPVQWKAPLRHAVTQGHRIFFIMGVGGG